ncbi:hypothetical protein [Actinoplanes derwentensis]|uniref:SPW repeat-containing protein n=1 Tax=Actinoplanes derwentensis TaxID=113562 RepID=A0A1H2D6G4_9ACTN|nr:hypothetical protein [Actinoplanes derwentensis]GID85630.1 hypothetical protein Ade03nite_45540 [Actinoplanes derwentensis]SDT78169.1 hypothetical protein SAMN04489716_8261 [Actinoplanes derwentensis]
MIAVGMRFSLLPNSTKLSLSGLATGVAGLIIQWIADPSGFPGFPPGIGFIAVCAVLVMAFASRWWAPVFSVLISLWIVVGGWAAGLLIPNFRSDDAGTVTGNAVMTAGLVFAAGTGVVAMIAARRKQP